MKMTDKNRKRIIKDLEYCIENKCDICQEENGSGFPWIDARCYGFTERLYDAITFLKNTADSVQVVRCKDCKHRPTKTRDKDITGFAIEFPDYHCPCQCEDPYYNWFPDDNWFCAHGERRDEDD